MSQRKAFNNEETPFISGSMGSDGTARASKHDNFSRSMRIPGFAGDYGEPSRSLGWKGMRKSNSWSSELSRLFKANNRETNDTALLGKSKKRTSWLPNCCRRKPMQG